MFVGLLKLLKSRLESEWYSRVPWQRYSRKLTFQHSILARILDSRPQSRACQREWICGQNSLAKKWAGKTMHSFAGETGLGFSRFWWVCLEFFWRPQADIDIPWWWQPWRWPLFIHIQSALSTFRLWLPFPFSHWTDYAHQEIWHNILYAPWISSWSHQNLACFSVW